MFLFIFDFKDYSWLRLGLGGQDYIFGLKCCSRVDKIC